MSRAHLSKGIIRKTSGLPADGSCQVYEDGSTTPLAQSMFTADSGATVLANPFTFTNGVIEFYLATPQRVRLDITPTGGVVQTFDHVDVEPVAAPPASVTFGTVGEIASDSPGSSALAGATGHVADAGHRHGREAWGLATDITTSAVADTAAAGATGKTADAGHRHAREGFGTVTAQTSYGAASSNGVATTEARSDHTHGTPSLPTPAAIGALPTTGGTLTGPVSQVNLITTGVVAPTTAYNVATNDAVVLASGTFTVTLPAAAGNTGRRVDVKNIGTGTITVATSGGNIDGSATAVIAKQYNSITFISDGTNWWII